MTHPDAGALLKLADRLERNDFFSASERIKMVDAIRQAASQVSAECELQLVCSNKPRPSVQKGAKGNQHWRRDVHHVMQPRNMAGRDELTLCGINASDWLVIGPVTDNSAEDSNLCERCRTALPPPVKTGTT